MPDPPQFPLIIGPTAGGKSELAVEVALELGRRGRTRGGASGGGSGGEPGGAGAPSLTRGPGTGAPSLTRGPWMEPGGEVVTADAFQVYRRMDIGTAKPCAAERRGVAHHLIDLIEPDDPEPFTVHRWLELAERTIADIRRRGRVPIVVGGTHLYAKALLEGMFQGPGADAELRAELEAMDPAARRAELERVDPGAAGRIHRNDVRRTVRALEVFRLSGRPISDWQGQWDREGAAREDVLLVGLEWPAEAVNRRINARVRAMVERGLVDEARGLWEAGRLGPQAAEALGYKQLVEHFAGRMTLEEAVERIKIETRRFAKNQRTWLRRLRRTPGAIWLDMEGLDVAAAARRVVDRLLGAADGGNRRGQEGA